MTRVFIIHGWADTPNNGWFPWLRKELERKGYVVIAPQMPEANVPRIEKWIPYLQKIVGAINPAPFGDTLQVRRAHIAERCGVDENTYFVGHSIGCQAIIRFLDTFDGNQKIGGAVFVGGWLPPLLKGITDKEKKLARPWLETPIDFRKVKKIINQCVAIFSDNDYYVPLANQDIFKKELGAEIIIEHQKGHLGGADGITELPSARGALLKIIEKS